MNKVILIGNFGKDPEIKTTNTGKSVLSFDIAVKRRFGEGTDWITIVAWEKKAETIAKFFGKGSRILVEGRMETRSWESDNGRRYATEVILEEFYFVDKKSDGGYSGGYSISASASTANSVNYDMDDITETTDDLDGLPF